MAGKERREKGKERRTPPVEEEYTLHSDEEEEEVYEEEEPRPVSTGRRPAPMAYATSGRDSGSSLAKVGVAALVALVLLLLGWLVLDWVDRRDQPIPPLVVNPPAQNLLPPQEGEDLPPIEQPANGTQVGGTQVGNIPPPAPGNGRAGGTPPAPGGRYAGGEGMAVGFVTGPDTLNWECRGPYNALGKCVKSCTDAEKEHNINCRVITFTQTYGGGGGGTRVVYRYRSEKSHTSTSTTPKATEPTSSPFTGLSERVLTNILHGTSNGQ